MDLQLGGKVALVTGGTRGIGLATARLFAQEGCLLGICGRDEEKLRAVEEELRGMGARVCGVVADVTKSEDAERFVDACVSELGGVDVLVNNVGGSSGGPTIFDTSDEDWHRTFDISFLHGVRLTQLVAPPHEESGRRGHRQRVVDFRVGRNSLWGRRSTGRRSRRSSS